MSVFIETSKVQEITGNQGDILANVLSKLHNGEKLSKGESEVVKRRGFLKGQDINFNALKKKNQQGKNVSVFKTEDDKLIFFECPPITKLIQEWDIDMVKVSMCRSDLIKHSESENKCATSKYEQGGGGDCSEEDKILKNENAKRRVEALSNEFQRRKDKVGYLILINVLRDNLSFKKVSDMQRSDSKLIVGLKKDSKGFSYNDLLERAKSRNVMYKFRSEHMSDKTVKSRFKDSLEVVYEVYEDFVR